MAAPALREWPHLLISKMGFWERVSAALAAIALLATTQLPIWCIRLASGQYPEGLKIYIWPRDVQGDLQNVNILNHYIGMAPIDSASFAEFHWLTPALVIFGALALISSLLRHREVALLTWLGYAGFNAYMALDLFHWLWTWGHNLDPRAPIHVPPFLPPVVGFEQIANFGVWSLPSWGGWLMILSAVLGPVSIWLDLRSRR